MSYPVKNVESIEVFFYSCYSIIKTISDEFLLLLF